MKKETFKEIQKIEKHFDKDMKQKTLAEKREIMGEDDMNNLYYLYREEDVKQSIKQFDKRLKEELNKLLIDSNKVCGQALLNKKEEGYSEEHIFDNFFRRIQNGNQETIDKIKQEVFGEELV